MLPPAFAGPSAPARAIDGCLQPLQLQGVGLVCSLRPGLYEVFSPDGSVSLGFTHGPDARCTDCPEGPIALQSTGTPHCATGAPGEYYIHVIYARAADDEDRYATMEGTVRSLVTSASRMVDDSARATGDSLSLRVICAADAVKVENVVLTTHRANASFSTIVNELIGRGYNDPRQKYWVYYDDTAACACAGVGHIYYDETASVDNLNNAGPGAAAMFAVIFDQNGVRAMLHELGHTLGAVQDGAPTSTLAGHCYDGRDTMCYNDGGPRGPLYRVDFCTTEVFDCHNDTYCNAFPPEGSYLATRWQVCSRVSRFVEYAPNIPPAMTNLDCSPTPSYPDETVTCTFRATDLHPSVHYAIDWDDGTTTRVPAAGTVASGTTQTAQHVYTSQAQRTIRVNATDIGFPPLTSAPAEFAHSVLQTNVPPVVTGLSCSPNNAREGDTVSCSFWADDVQNVSYAVQWGDGATLRVPPTGVALPSTVQTVTHAFTRGGLYPFNVTATDDGRPVRVGPTAQVVLDIEDVNTAPVMKLLDCPIARPRPGQTVYCNMAAEDDSFNVRYRIDWGDGLSEWFPAQGYVAPGVAVQASHVYAADADITVGVHAQDDGEPPLASPLLARVFLVRADQEGPTIGVVHPAPATLYRNCASTAPKPVGNPMFLSRGCVHVGASDAAGVARVEVLHGNVVIASDLTFPYILEFDVPATGLGVEYRVRAFDNVGNARLISLTVDSLADAR